MEIATIKEELLKLKCSVCNNLLTVAPITITASAGNEFKCGRCKHIKNADNEVRNILFENIAKHLTFSCIFNNCQESLVWDQIATHEDICPNKQINCPLKNQCPENSEEVYTLGTLETHMTSRHANYNLTFNNDQSLSIQIDIHDGEGTIEAKVLFLKLENLQFILFVHNKCITLTSMGLQQGLQTNYYTKFNIKLSSSESQYSVILENEKIFYFNERYHCIECLNETCSSTLHPFSTVNNNDITVISDYYGSQINWRDISRIFSNSVNLTFNLLSDESRSNNGFELAPTMNLHFDELRKLLECIVCLQYMKSPIYNCRLGHSICSGCKQNIDHCPTCRDTMTESRNYALQNIVENVQFPCKFWTNGCSVMNTILNIVTHEMNCPQAN